MEVNYISTPFSNERVVGYNVRSFSIFYNVYLVTPHRIDKQQTMILTVL